MLRAVGAQLIRESPQLAQAFAMAPVLALGCTGLRAQRLGRLLSLTALGLFWCYLFTGNPFAALGTAATVVPGALLTSYDRSQLAELERRALAWRLTQRW